MPVFGNILAGASGQGGGYTIDQSIRFNDNDSPYLTWTPGANASSQTTFTISMWFKRSDLSNNGALIAGYGGSGATLDEIRFNSGDGKIYFRKANVNVLVTTQVLRDPSAWYHLVLAVDTNNATSGDRYKLYLNGVRITAFDTATYPSSGATFTGFTKNVAQYVGDAGAATGSFDGYLAEINMIDGQALDPTSFGKTNADTGQWVPKKYTGSYGTNGFYITGADSADLGADDSGNGNDFTSSGLTAADQMLDTPTNNFWTLNPADPHSSNITISDGNLRAKMGAATTGSVFASMLPETGKWAWEITATLNMGSGTEYPVLGIVPANNADLSGPMRAGGTGEGYGADGRFFSASNGTNSAYGATWADGDIIEVGWDADNGALSFWHNGSAQGTAVTGLTGRWKPAQDHYTTAGGDTLTDFGQSGYTPTDSSYKTLCTANLDDPTIADPSAYFQTTTYTGNGTAIGSGGNAVDQSGNSTFQPDFVWIKNRDAADNHMLYDAVRGATKDMHSNSTNAEATDTEGLSTFDADGFTVGSNVEVNTNTENYVGWQWKANGAGSTNEDGSITSTVSANTTSGFSIATYTGNGTSGATFGHGLGVAPKMVIVKERSPGGNNWMVGHDSVGWTKYLALDTSAASVTSSARWNNTAPSSTVVTLGNDTGINASGATYVSYCFAEVEGFSKFGSYKGNGSTDGPFIYTGFMPEFIMVKSSSNSGTNWDMLDATRETYNTRGNQLFANLTNAEANNDHECDFLSNGFKWRDGSGSNNGSGYTIIYMAFARSPFKTSIAQ